MRDQRKSWENKHNLKHARADYFYGSSVSQLKAYYSWHIFIEVGIMIVAILQNIVGKGSKFLPNSLYEEGRQDIWSVEVQEVFKNLKKYH